MRRYKKFILLALTAAAIILGALLPGFAAAVQDAAWAKPSSVQMQSVELTFHGSGTALDALWLIRSATVANAAPVQPAMTEAQVLAIAGDAVSAYASVGLMPELDLSAATATASLAYDETAPESSGRVIWYVSAGDNTLDLVVDDATGCILQLYYFSNEDTYAELDKGDCLDAISDLYFQMLGTPGITEDPERYGLSYLLRQEQAESGGTQTLQYILIHPQMDVLIFNITVYDAGFFVNY